MSLGEANLEEKPLFRVTDLKQWVYCPRLLYYFVYLPQVRPEPANLELGREAGEEEMERERRRVGRAYFGRGAGAKIGGERAFEVEVESLRYGLRGKVDLVIWREEEVIPVDYKLSTRLGEHVELQLIAYGALLEEISGKAARRGFVYLIPLRRAEEVRFASALRRKLQEALEGMRKILEQEWMPPPTPQRRKCLNCEFRRFCNDVL